MYPAVNWTTIQRNHYSPTILWNKAEKRMEKHCKNVGYLWDDCINQSINQNR